MNLRLLGIITFFSGATLLTLALLLDLYSGKDLGSRAITFDKASQIQRITEQFSFINAAEHSSEYKYYLSSPITLTPSHSPLKLVFTSSFSHYDTPFKGIRDFGKRAQPSNLYLIDSTGNIVWQKTETHFNRLSKLSKASSGQAIGSSTKTGTFNDIQISNPSEYRVLIHLHEQAYMGLKPIQSFNFRSKPVDPIIVRILLFAGGILLLVGAVFLARTYKTS